jgi:phosphoenolpyruvate carboxykinase (ATP)
MKGIEMNERVDAVELPFSVASARFNAAPVKLLEEAIARGEGKLSAHGAFVAETGKFTGRSPKDKHIVVRPDSEADIWWDGNNRMEPASFERLRTDMFAHIAGCDVEVQDLLSGADPDHAVRIRLVADYAWHALFLNHLLIVPDEGERADFEPDFTIVNVPGFFADPERHGCKSETVIALDFESRMVLIAGTEYAGENKKAVFTILNHLYPEKGILPMHCSANHAQDDPDDLALFFGLSGTGKTTLSADPERVLIGDDEHGWSDGGVFNFEDGCYAKTINLRQDAEPDIWNAVHRFGTVLENVVLDSVSRVPDLDDGSLTENARAAYPMEAVANSSATGFGGQPRHVFFLTCDANGVTPPILKLPPDRARDLFLLGFTSKAAGTERGVTAPAPTFSTCFAAPFLTREPGVYADMFADRLRATNATCWLLNTGYTGGAAGQGARMPIAVTRAVLSAAMSGAFNTADFRQDPVWDLPVPVDGPAEAMPYFDPRATWSDAGAFDIAARALRAQIHSKMRHLGLTPENGAS